MVSLLLHLLPPAQAAWHGPVALEASIPIVGNPYSPAENDVRVVITQGSVREERLAYYDQGIWRAVFVSRKTGAFSAQFVRNGKPIGEAISSVVPSHSAVSFVTKAGSRFQLSDGTPFMPFGYNIAWQGPDDKPYSVQLADMAKAGLNWTRIWANHWDGKNPIIRPDYNQKVPVGTFWPDAISRWDEIVKLCEKEGIRFQFVLFHHGLFSTRTNPNWQIHPWNEATGGFLKRPEDFFTDPKAEELTKSWLRYAVARWGHSPSLMAWELFNEVEWTDAAGTPEGRHAVAQWHGKMADYLRKIDPYHHLITSSSGGPDEADTFQSMDFLQPHVYAKDLYATLAEDRSNQRTLSFYGEVGGDQGRDFGKDERLVVRDAFWGGLMKGDSAPGQYWFADRVYKNSLFPEYERLSNVLRLSQIARHREAGPGVVSVETGGRHELLIRPRRSWEGNARYSFRLPEDIIGGVLPGASSMIFGAKSANWSKSKEPLRFNFSAKAPGMATLVISHLHNNASLEVHVNGSLAFEKSWNVPSGEVTEQITIPYPAGPVEIRLDNLGTGFVSWGELRIPQLDTGVTALALVSDDYGLARLQWHRLPSHSNTIVNFPKLKDAKYRLTQIDGESGKEFSRIIAIKGGVISPYKPQGDDEALIVERV